MAPFNFLQPNLINPVPESPNALQQIVKAVGNVANGVRVYIEPNSPLDIARQKIQKFFRPEIVSPIPTTVTRSIPSSFSIPTSAPTPTIPLPTPTPAYPNWPGIPNDADPNYLGRTWNLEPKLYDALQEVKNNLLRQYLSALAAQESSGGRNLYGDYINGVPTSFGPYHIKRTRDRQGNPITQEQMLDPRWSTQYALSELQHYINAGYSVPEALRKWNWNSGYPEAPRTYPRYDVELPRMATTSSFLRGK